jgi:ATP-independent RNA helicase DbpA
MSEHKFSSLDLHVDLLKNLDSLGYQTMTAVQAKSLPFILEGRDVIAQAKTGSGKTAAFGLGLLQKLEVKRFRIQSLILCPTRELADQVAKEIRKLARSIHNIKVLTLCGGMPFGPQAGSLEHGAHIIVGTPGRIEDHLGRGTLTLNDVNMLILDEADRMLDMGFQTSVDTIIEQIPGKRQTLLFSATFPDQIESMIKRVMNTPAMVKIEEVHDDASIEQHFYQVPDSQYRFTALRLLLLHYSPGSTLIFCNTKKETQDVADKLNEFGFSALALHGDLEQRDRDITLVRFSNKSISILVATDVAARGLDIDELDAVINYHIAHDAEIHTHRIGRTGRAGRSGIACSLFTENEGHKVAMLETTVDPIVDAEPLPPVVLLDKHPMQPVMVTIRIDGGKKQKVRPGDILGALTGKKGIAGKQVGKIQIFENWAYVAVNQKVAKPALQKLMHGKLKGRTFRARLLEDG